MVDDNGRLVAKQRIAESAAGFRELLELLAVHGQSSDEPLPIAIETAKGLLPAALHAVGYQLFSINPLALLDIETATRSAGPRATRAMRWCWRTSCAPTSPRIAPFPMTAS